MSHLLEKKSLCLVFGKKDRVSRKPPVTPETDWFKSPVKHHVRSRTLTKNMSKFIRIRKSFERGSANLGWLKSKHTFSFANYHDPKYMGLGSLRVINEDHLSPGKGFDAHPHRDFEIFSYVIKGAIKHQDSMGNQEICHPGDIQFTSAGKGVSHSEYSAPEYGPLHFLQIWVKPDRFGITPSYTTRHFSNEQKRGKLCLCLSSSGGDCININQDVKVFASLLGGSEPVVDYVVENKRQAYLHLIEGGGALEISTPDETLLLQPGDGAFLLVPQRVSFKGISEQLAHFVLIDVNTK
jgi:quercetin 2,3-dioxygenase